MNNIKEKIIDTKMYNVRDIQRKLGCTSKESRRVIREINKALSDQGQIIASWGVPVQCFEEFKKGNFHANLQRQRDKKI